MNIFERLLLELMDKEQILSKVKNIAKLQGIDDFKSKCEQLHDKWFDGKDDVIIPLNQVVKDTLQLEAEKILKKQKNFKDNTKLKFAVEDWPNKIKNIDKNAYQSIIQILTNIDAKEFARVTSSGIFNVPRYILDENGERIQIDTVKGKPVYKTVNNAEGRPLIDKKSRPWKGEPGYGDTPEDKKVRFIKAVQDLITSKADKTTQNEYSVVISRDIDKIARMSYERSWDSCKNLDTGKNNFYIPSEIREGVLVAYLIKNNDIEIEHPFERVLIIPYHSVDNIRDIYFVIANTVYRLKSASPISGFRNTIQQWLDSKQGKKTGKFTMNAYIYNDNNIQNLELHDNYDNLSVDEKLKLLGLVRI